MKTVFVLHPRFTLYGGGEAVCLHVCKVLQELGFHVHLACDNFNPEEAERHLGLGRVMAKCVHVPLVGEFVPSFHEKFVAYQRAAYFIRLLRSIRLPANSCFVFSTQTILFFKPDLLNFCVAYDAPDFLYSHDLIPIVAESPLKRMYYLPLRTLYQHYAYHLSRKNNYFIPLSQSIQRSIERLNYPHSAAVFPPCEMSFRARPKKDFVVNTSRLVPSKRLEDFIEVARKLPQYNFVILGKMSETERRLFPNYREKLLGSLPANVTLLEGLVRDHKDLVESAKVYLYPSVEPGVSVSLGQAMGAGCIPIAPNAGGGAEMVEASGVGYLYHSLDEAARIIKHAMSSNTSKDQPEHIAERATQFSADSFDERVRLIIEERVSPARCTDPSVSAHD